MKILDFKLIVSRLELILIPLYFFFPKLVNRPDPLEIPMQWLVQIR